MKAYTTKSNALRAAKSAGFTKEQVEICEYEGGYTWIEVVAAPVEEVKVITEAAELKDLPPGHYTVSGEAAVTLVEQMAKNIEAAHTPAPVEPKVAPIGEKIEGDVRDYNCPHCGINLSNGVGNHEDDVNGKHVVFTKEFEYWCMACEGEFGPALVVAKHVAGKANHFKVEIKNESTAERPCKSVWAIADSMPGARRKEVLAACVEKGIAYNTARTQYQQWYQLNNKKG